MRSCRDLDRTPRSSRRREPLRDDRLGLADRDEEPEERCRLFRDRDLELATRRTVRVCDEDARWRCPDDKLRERLKRNYKIKIFFKDSDKRQTIPRYRYCYAAFSLFLFIAKCGILRICVRRTKQRLDYLELPIPVVRCGGSLVEYQASDAEVMGSSPGSLTMHTGSLFVTVPV